MLALSARRAGIGTVLGTRSPVRISQFGGRLPDLFFVRREREHLITQKATLCAPDLVLEIVSPNDRRADINATEADYQTLGVGEIVYIDQPRRRVRVLRKTDTAYEEEALSDQPLTLHALGGLRLTWDWLFTEPRPDGSTRSCHSSVSAPRGQAPLTTKEARRHDGPPFRHQH